MNDDVLEALIRAKFRATAPLEVPDTLAIRAAAIPQTTHRSARRAWSPSPERARRWPRFGTVATGVVGVAIIGALLLSQPGERGSVAAPGVPTLPPIMQPSLPPAAANPTTIIAGAWVSATVAWLVDDQSRLRMTTDGGLTWSGPRPLPQRQDELRAGPTFLDSSVGYAAWAPADTFPMDVTLYRTVDGGRTWSAATVGTLSTRQGHMRSLTAHFSDTTHGVVVAGDYITEPISSGHAGAGVRVLACAGWSTADGGRVWAPIVGAPCSADVWASSEIGLELPLADGGTDVALTFDGGLTWETGVLPGIGVDDASFPVLFTVTADGAPRLAYYVVHGSDPARTVKPIIVAESHDRGASWQEAYVAQVPGAASGDFVVRDAVVAIGPDHWLANGVSAGGTDTPHVPILETTDGGRTWTAVGTLGSIDGSVRTWFDRLHGMASGQDDSGCALPSGTPCHSISWFLTKDGGQTWHGVPF